MTPVEGRELRRLEKLIIELVPGARRIEVYTRDRLQWRIVAQDEQMREICAWTGRCDTELAAVAAAHRWWELERSRSPLRREGGR